MSQLNLQQILSGDNISELVDKLNYNFDQLVLNGGGPQGLRGIIGPPGLPGSQGDQGVTGPTGADGTYLYGSDLDPDAYTFGASGESLPRERDLFLEAQPTYINVWQLGATGWNLIETVQSPSSGMKLVYDGYDPGGTSGDTSNSNDPNVAGKFLYGSVQALYSPNIIDPSYDINSTAPRRVLSLSSAPIIGNDSLVTLAAQTNQLRILTSSDYLDWNDRIATGGGILHSMEVKLQSIPGIGSTHQIYRISHADVQGNKHLVVDVSSIAGSNSTLLYGDEKNRLVVSGDELERVVANFNARNSGAIGSANFYAFNNNSADPSFENSIGMILQGNLTVGRNKNTIASISAFSDPIQGSVHSASYPFGTQITRILADVNRTTSSPGTSTAFSEISLSVNAAGQYFDGQTGVNSANWWRFTHDGRKHVTNSQYGYLRVLGTHNDLLSSHQTFNTTPLTIGATAQTSPLAASTMVGINNQNPLAILDIGSAANRISIGQSWNAASVSSISYIGFNAARSPLSAGSWIRRASGGASGGNSGNVIWKDITDSALQFSFFDSGSTGTTGTMTDSTVYAATRTVLRNGSILSAELNRPEAEGATYSLGMYIGFGASGTTGSGFEAGNYRRYLSVFGRGITSSDSISPMISTTNGLTGSTTAFNFPQYSFYGSPDSGLYLGMGYTGNGGGTASRSLGLSLRGYAGVSIHYIGESSLIPNNVRVGISQDSPLDRMHIGKYLTIHEGNDEINTNQTYIGHNMYYDVATNSNKRIYGSTASDSWRGASRIVFDDTDRATTSVGVTGYNSVAKFTSIGSKLRFDVAAPGPTGATYDINQWSVGYTQRSVVIQPPPIGPTATQAAGFYAFQTQVPQMTIGLKNDASRYSDNDPSGNTAKRGTLSLAAQMRVKPSSSQFLQTTIEDKYNIGLYSYDGYPVAGIYSSGGDTSTMINKTLGFSMLGSDGDAVAQDVSLLEFKVLEATIDSPETTAPMVGRVANFGPGVRVGMGPNVSTSVLMDGLNDTIYDAATLVVEAIETGVGPADRVAAAFKGGSVIIDLTDNNANGGNMGLIFKDASLVYNTYSSLPSVPNPSTYRMDWGIQYTTAAGATGGLTWGGLNFGKAGDTPSLFGNFNYILWLQDTGNVGIGTGAPVAKLHVSGGTPYGGTSGNASPSSPYYWFSGTMGQNTIPNNPIWGSGRTLSIRASNDVWANLFVASSDLRIKDVVRVSDGLEDLESIKMIQVTDYRYKDMVTNGDQIHKKLIAQNVKEAIPGAVTVSSDFIPNIYQLSEEVNHSDGLTTIKINDLKDLKVGDRVKLIPEDEQTPIHVEILSVDNDASSFTFKSDVEHEKFFVYGTEISDFQMVDYDSVFSMHISATQQLCKIVDEKDAQIKKLEDRLSKIEELLSKNNIV
jgi:hypothetical protein